MITWIFVCGSWDFPVSFFEDANKGKSSTRQPLKLGRQGCSGRVSSSFLQYTYCSSFKILDNLVHTFMYIKVSTNIWSSPCHRPSELLLSLSIHRCSIFSNGGHIFSRIKNPHNCSMQNNTPMNIHTKFGSKWSSSVRGEELWKIVDNRCQVMAIAHIAYGQVS